MVVADWKVWLSLGLGLLFGAAAIALGVLAWMHRPQLKVEPVETRYVRVSNRRGEYVLGSGPSDQGVSEFIYLGVRNAPCVGSETAEPPADSACVLECRSESSDVRIFRQVVVDDPRDFNGRNGCCTST
jgi:hypothetical protein